MEAEQAKPYFEGSEWKACEAIQVVCFIITLYILYALVHFYMLQQSRKVFSGQSKGSRWLEKMCIIAVVCAIARFTSNQLLLFIWWKSNALCSILLNISIALYFISLYPVYLFLWIRQRIFYSNGALKHLYNRVIRFISWATIFCFVFVTAVSMAIFVVDRTNSASERVCGGLSSDEKSGEPISSNGTIEPSGETVNDDSDDHEHDLQVNTIAGLLGGVIQSSFLALFLYPIMDNKLRSSRNLNVRSHRSLMKLIRRSFFLSGVCILTDVAIAFGVRAVHGLFPKAVFALIVMYDVNLIVNIICIIATFRRWRLMLFPWMYDCYGRSILPPESQGYALRKRQSNAGLNGSNVGSFKIIPSPKREIWSVKVPGFMLECGDEESEENNCQQGENIVREDDSPAEDKKGNEKDTTTCSANVEEVAPSCSRFEGFFSSGRTKDSFGKSVRRYTTGSADKNGNYSGGTSIVSSARLLFRSKQDKNVVTTKFVVKSESIVLMDKTPE